MKSYGTIIVGGLIYYVILGVLAYVFWLELTKPIEISEVKAGGWDSDYERIMRELEEINLERVELSGELPRTFQDKLDGVVEVAEYTPIELDAPLNRPPQIAKITQPIYPEALRAAGIEGAVKVSVVVSAEGEVLEMYVVESTDVGFEEAALECIEQWEFGPAIHEGNPRETRLTVPVKFTLGPQPTQQGAW